VRLGQSDAMRMVRRSSPIQTISRLLHACFVVPESAWVHGKFGAIVVLPAVQGALAAYAQATIDVASASFRFGHGATCNALYGTDVKKELRKLAQLHGLRGRQQAMQAVTVLRMYRKDPKANDFLRHEPERILRRVLYHLRQAAIFERLAERDTTQPFLVSLGAAQRGPK
jgi:hypothetical protein